MQSRYIMDTAAIKRVAYYFILFVAFLFIALLGPFIIMDQLHKHSTVQAAANITFGSGYYINLSGGGADLNGNINAYNDEANCNTAEGWCVDKNRFTGAEYGGRVERYVCNGKVLNCDNTNSPGNVIRVDSGPSETISDANASCNQTVQLDVFDSNHALHGFMTWYSGDCSSSTPTPAPNTVVTCNNRTLTQSQLESELRGAGYPGPWGDINVELQAFNRAACPQSTPTPTPTTVMVTTCNGRTISQSQMESELHNAGYPGPWGDINMELQAFNRAACPNSMPTPTPASITVTTCNGRVISQSQLESELRGAGYPGPWGDVNVELQAFNRAACPQSTPTPTTVTQVTVTTCNGRMISQQQMESELRNAGYPGPWGDVNVELAAFNRAACPTPTPTPSVVQQSPQPNVLQVFINNVNKLFQHQSQSQQQTVTVNTASNIQPSPSASSSSSTSPTASPSQSASQSPQGQSQTQSQSQSVAVNTQSSPYATPAVLGTNTQSVTELPKTGLPLAGLLLSGLGPIAWKLRRFSSQDDEKWSANDRWQRRVMKKS